MIYIALREGYPIGCYGTLLAAKRNGSAESIEIWSTRPSRRMGFWEKWCVSHYHYGSVIARSSYYLSDVRKQCHMRWRETVL